MFSSERINTIYAYLKEHKSATVAELTKFLYASEATVRRDLTRMQQMGMIERSHGGAVLVENTGEQSIFVRQEKNAKEKDATLSVALKFLPEFKSVFIDNSSTCLALAERMNLAHKIVITNGLQVAMRLSQKESVSIIMPGGEVHYNTNSVTGALTCSMLRSFSCDLMLSSCAGLDEEGTYENSIETMQIKQTAYEQCRTRLLLADDSKFGKTSVYRTRRVTDYDALITNANDKQLEAYRGMGITIYNK